MIRILAPLLLLVVAGCAAIQSEHTGLVEVTAYYEPQDVVLEHPGCVYWLPEAFEQRDKHLEWLEAHPEHRTKANGWVDADGLRQGRWTEWHRPGGLREEGDYLDDVRVGTWLVWWDGSRWGEEKIVYRLRYNADGTCEKG